MADLTKRAKAIPTWYYGVGAVGVAGLYFLYSRRKAAKAAAATTSSTQAADMTGTAAGYSSQDLAAVLAQMQGAGSTAPGSTTSDYTTSQFAQPSDYTTPFGEAVTGFGYRPTQGVTSVVGPSGVTYSQVANAKARNALINSGQKVFYQPAPGVFQPYNPATMNKTQTPTFVAVS